MPDQNPRVRRAQRPRRQDILHFLRLQDLRPRQPRIPRPTGHDQRQNHLADSRTEKRGKRNRQQNSWERQKRIDQHDVHEPIQPPAEITRHRPNRQPDDPGAEHHANTHQHRHPGPENNPRQNVAPQFVGPHPMLRRRPYQPGRQILRRRTIRRDPWRRQRHQHQQ